MVRTCQNKVSADQHHLNISRAEAYCSLRVGFLADRWPFAGFSIGSRAQARFTCCIQGRVFGSR